jgi:hypothetical protein
MAKMKTEVQLLWKGSCGLVPKNRKKIVAFSSGEVRIPTAGA